MVLGLGFGTAKHQCNNNNNNNNNNNKHNNKGTTIASTTSNQTANTKEPPDAGPLSPKLLSPPFRL